MQTERVTFLTSRDHKAALDAYAASNGRSVGHVLREASTRYIVEGEKRSEEDEYEQALELILPELEEMLPKMMESIESMHRSIEHARAAIRESLDAVEATKR